MATKKEASPAAAPESAQPTTITITNRWSGSTIYTHVATDATVRAAVLAAVGAGADLGGANLGGANLRDAARLTGFQIPQEGELIVWKKLRMSALAKLRIPADAARTATPVGRKCRAAFADVLHIEDASGVPITEGASMHQGAFIYRVGEPAVQHFLLGRRPLAA